MNILFTCGGTAGHVNPAVALARRFQQEHPQCNILFVGADGGMDVGLVTHEGFAIETVTISNFWRSFDLESILHNLKSLINMQRSKSQAAAILRKFQPDLVVGTGGYASYPIVKAAARKGIPTAVHESNAIPGLTTKALSKVVDCVMVGLVESKNHYDCPEKVVVTGTPVRDDFFQYTKKEAREKLGIYDDRPVLLSYFGSLGATVMNEQVIDFIAQEVGAGSPFHHIHGAGRDFGSMTASLEKQEISLDGTAIQLKEYIYDMPLVMAACDLVLCRGGASTSAELTAIGKPAIVVPSPNVTANHQEKNARVLEQGGGVVVLLERELEKNSLYATAETLLKNPEKLEAMHQSMLAIGVPEAGDRIYETLLGLLK